MSTKKRAVTDQLKNEKREKIVEAAKALHQLDLESIPSVISIAKAAKAAKGTVYLYFTSKEEIFLKILSELLEEWFTDLIEIFDKEILSQKKITPNVIADTYVESLKGKDQMLTLCDLSLNNLEASLSEELAKSYRAELASLVRNYTDKLAERARLSTSEALEMHMLLYSSIIGAWHTRHVNIYLNFKGKNASKIENFYAVTHKFVSSISSTFLP